MFRRLAFILAATLTRPETDRLRPRARWDPVRQETTLSFGAVIILRMGRVVKGKRPVIG